MSAPTNLVGDLDQRVAELNAALARAQGAFPPIPRNRKVNTGSYQYEYADLASILNAVRPALTENGLSVTQMLESFPPGEGLALRTDLRHESGGVMSSSFRLPKVPESVQQLGSLITYVRRYALTALLAIAAEDDDDGAQATKAAEGGQQGAQFRQPAPKGVTEAQHRKMGALYARLADLETQLDGQARDWAAWSRDYAQVQSRKDLDTAGAARLIDALEREESRLVANLARKAQDEAAQQP